MKRVISRLRRNRELIAVAITGIAVFANIHFTNIQFAEARNQTDIQIAEARSLADKQIAESRSLANKQIAETRSLTVLTKELDDRVNRLAANLDQRVSRLNRLNELVRDSYLSSTRILQKAKILRLADNETAISMEWLLQHFTIEELAENQVIVDWSTVEMFAIANVVDDRELSRALFDFSNSFPKSPIGITVDEFLESYNTFAESARVVHQKIYDLLQDSTDAPEL